MSIVEANEKTKFRNTGKKVLLFSGGLDSMCTAWIIDPELLLYIKTGSKYEHEELKKLQKIRSDMLDIDMIVDESIGNYGKINERNDFIVPNRNAMLLLTASLYGETLYLAATDGDRSSDKDFRFAELTKTLLNHMWRNQHWTEDRTFDIILPFKHLTKYELLKEAISAEMPLEYAIKSFSCYTPTEEGKECGTCKACIRNWSAIYLAIKTTPDIIGKPGQMYNNDELILMLKSKYNTHPYDSLVNSDLLDKVVKGNWRGREDYQILQALNFFHFKVR